MIAVRVGAKRSISAAQLASRDAGATRRLVRRVSSRVARARITSSSASTCIVLPRPMSSARHAPRPRLESRCSHRTPAC